jgi:branched-chain amino acid transport system permease protein
MSTAPLPIPATAGPSEQPGRQWAGVVALLVLAAVVACIPLMPFANAYIVGLVVRVLLFIALGQAWNVIAGIGGQMSLGHGVFFGIGAYVTGLLFNDAGLTPWIGMWLAAIVAGVVALIVGAITFRLRGIYFALATVVISLGFEKVTRYYAAFTGGDTGLAIQFRGTAPAVMQWREPQAFLWLTLVLVVAYFIITRWLLRGDFGLSLQAVRDDEEAAAASGVNVYRTKILALLLSAVMTSLAGTLHLQFYSSIDPGTAFGLSQAIQIQLPALIGGLATAGGPVIGGVIMILLSEATNIASAALDLPGADILAYGLVLLFIVFKAPAGVLGLITSRKRPKSTRSMAPGGAH